MCNSTAHFAADNRLVQRLQSSVCPVVCHCMDQPNSQLLGVLGLSGRCFPKNCSILFRGSHPHVTHCSSGQAHSSSQTASRSVQPFLYGSQTLCCTEPCQWGRKPPKLSFPWDFATVLEENRSTAIGNIHASGNHKAYCKSFNTNFSTSVYLQMDHYNYQRLNSPVN